VIRLLLMHTRVSQVTTSTTTTNQLVLVAPVMLLQWVLLLVLCRLCPLTVLIRIL
jgi:hypothetical protein